jgi:photosystem II stability/assembly factor-like uncharacterized protein
MRIEFKFAPGLVKIICAALGVCLLTLSCWAQEPPQSSDPLTWLSLRGIGPAFMGGRISDIAVHPSNPSIWYVSAGSGGLWKTTNAGITWSAIFDDQPSYSIGAIAIDPTSPDVIWVGTGENVSGRHVGWGSGIYRSRNGGETWENMGLQSSEHIGKILFDPRDARVMFVAAEGPLWSAGGDRGLFKSSDGGETWRAVLEIDANTGVTDVEFDPANPDTLYAAAYQRRRSTAAFLAGGPNSGIYKSTDNGATWRQVTTGLPGGDMGKIGLAVTPADPNLVYATIEAGEEDKGFYRSTNKGESWEHRNAYLSGGTGPHYYQEIEASPENPDLVYQMDVFVHVTRDGGETFDYLESGRNKHSDNHALWIDPSNGKHLIIGTDAGLYESFDEGAEWRHISNLPLSQFYKVALDNSTPFYNVLGGTQDLGTLHGPSRTMNSEGVRNQDWYVPLGADGYGVAVDPTDPNTMYMEYQVGNLVRYDRSSEEFQDIQPQPAPGDPPERWNWDTPILISPHDSNRLYVGSQRLWRSDDRGDSWAPVSGDLTRNQNRLELDIMGRVWSVDALFDHGAMSKYNTLTAVTESPLAEGVLYIGSDDGLIHSSGDSGRNWTRSRALPGTPEDIFINDMEASLHDADTVFAVADAHKIGDFSPYVFESRDRGGSWRSISGDLPEGEIVWSIQQDHVMPDLLFLGAETGIYVSTNRGANWHKLNGNTPTISFRDIKIHRRDNDLVGATFGRGIFVLDDYSALRDIASGALVADAALFPVRDAWWYVPMVPGQAVGLPTFGSTKFVAPNPPFGALLTYHLKSDALSAKDSRRKAERDLDQAGADVPFPGWDRLLAESLESPPKALVLIRDADGQAVRWLEGPATKGIHRISWDLRHPAPDAISLEVPEFKPPWESDPTGPMAGPGRYSAELMLLADGATKALGEPRYFEVKPVPTAPDGTDFAAVAEFQKETLDLMREISSAERDIQRTEEQLQRMRAAVLQATPAAPALNQQLDTFAAALNGVKTRLSGDAIRGGRNEATLPSIKSRVQRVAGFHWGTRQMPTVTQKRSIEIASEEFAQLRADLSRLLDESLTELEAELEAAGAPAWK